MQGDLCSLYRPIPLSPITKPRALSISFSLDSSLVYSISKGSYQEMDKSHLRRQLAEKRRFMLNEGYVNDVFLVLEDLEGDEPNFVETIISTYLPSSSEYIRKLEETLEKTPVNFAGLERLIIKLKGASSSIGAENLTVAINELLSIFRRHKTDTSRLRAALGRVKSQHTGLKAQLQSYVEMLAKLKDDDEEADAESVGSNNVNG